MFRTDYKVVVLPLQDLYNENFLKKAIVNKNILKHDFERTIESK